MLAPVAPSAAYNLGGGYSQYPVQPSQSCDYLHPDNVMQGCIDAVKDALDDPGAKAVGGIAGAEALAVEAGLTCVYGAVNTASKNCQATTSEIIPPLVSDSDLVEPPLIGDNQN